MTNSEKSFLVLLPFVVLMGGIGLVTAARDPSVSDGALYFLLGCILLCTFCGTTIYAEHLIRKERARSLRYFQELERRL